MQSQTLAFCSSIYTCVYTYIHILYMYKCTSLYRYEDVDLRSWYVSMCSQMFWIVAEPRQQHGMASSKPAAALPLGGAHPGH